MIIPRYSIRWLLGLTTFCAGVSLVLSHAVRGRAWAIGVTSGLWSLVIAALFYIAAFLLAWLLDQALALNRRQRIRETGVSPFAPQEKTENPFIFPTAVPNRPAADTPPPITG